MGIEEEYLLIGPDGVPVAVAGAALTGASPGDGSSGPGGDVGPELTEQQLETGTRVCRTAEELATEVRAARSRAQEAAERAGARIAALGTSPFRTPVATSPDPRYLAMTREFALTAREQLTCGCHVHVGVVDDDEGVAVLDRIGPWLPTLLALSANSPYWHGEDSGFASYRAQVWNRWPTAGPIARLGDADAYHALVADLLATGTILDEGMIYFDARLSARYPTVEIRVADVCLDRDDAVLVGTLARALVETAARDAADGAVVPTVRPEHLRAATWRASRSGLSGDLVSPTGLRPAPAAVVVGDLVEHVAEALASAGDLELVRAGVQRVLQAGTGADRQRAWADDGNLGQVVDRATDATLA